MSHCDSLGKADAIGQSITHYSSAILGHITCSSVTQVLTAAACQPAPATYGGDAPMISAALHYRPEQETVRTTVCQLMSLQWCVFPALNQMHAWELNLELVWSTFSASQIVVAFREKAPYPHAVLARGKPISPTVPSLVSTDHRGFQRGRG